MTSALPDDTIVVRGGLMEPAVMEKTARRNERETSKKEGRSGVYSLSVFLKPRATMEEVAAIARCPHPQIRITTLGRLRAAGIRVEAWNSATGHARIEFDYLPSVYDLQGLANLFDEPIPNPAPRE